MTDIQTDAGDVAALWLATQQQIASRTAHEIKNTLNGVAVNLEVVRSRLERAGPGATASPAAAFAETASQQFELLTEQAEALLALVRPVRAPTDVALLVSPLLALLRTTAERDGVRLTARSAEGGSAVTAVEGATARLLVAGALLAALDGAGADAVECAVDAEADSARFTVRREGGGALRLPEAMQRIAADADVRLDVAPDCLTLSFPAAPRADDLTLGSG